MRQWRSAKEGENLIKKNKLRMKRRSVKEKEGKRESV